MPRLPRQNLAGVIELIVKNCMTVYTDLVEHAPVGFGVPVKSSLRSAGPRSFSERLTGHRKVRAGQSRTQSLCWECVRPLSALHLVCTLRERFRCSLVLLKERKARGYCRRSRDSLVAGE